METEEKKCWVCGATEEEVSLSDLDIHACGQYICQDCKDDA